MVEAGSMVALTYVVGVGGGIRPEIAAMTQSEALLGGAGARCRQTATLVPFDSNIVKIRVGEGHS